MKQLVKTFFAVLFTLSISSCTKQPYSSFTTDKETYFAGETVHCKNTSIEAHFSHWVYPDGSTYTKKDLDYEININNLGGIETITLVTSSENGKKTDSISKFIKIIPVPTPISGYSKATSNDWFLWDGSSPLQLIERMWGNIGFNWNIDAFAGDLPNFNSNDHYTSFVCHIYLPGNLPPTVSKTYELTDSLSNDSAFVQIDFKDFDKFYTFGDSKWSMYSTRGQLSISITPEFKIRATFNNVEARTYDNAGIKTNHTMSGDITCR